ncbi:hypothetical protein BGZ63DRAFT_383803 [Mariannaea sp. PMI_226]|nr:hypothetical protein BGZ63DRAFT_383803 [Mariannaea sp. PMI_226]
MHRNPPSSAMGLARLIKPQDRHSSIPALQSQCHGMAPLNSYKLCTLHARPFSYLTASHGVAVASRVFIFSCGWPQALYYSRGENVRISLGDTPLEHHLRTNFLVTSLSKDTHEST